MTEAQTRRRRADAERSIEAIVQAAVAGFRRQPDVSMSEIAAAAGVGRVTLYAHFPSRRALIAAAAQRVLEDASGALDAADIDRGPAREALGRLVRAGWSVLDRSRGILAVERELAPSVVRTHHHEVLEQMGRLIARGQADGVFRTDMPLSWLVATCYSLFHAAAEEVGEGRLDATDVEDVLEATILGAISAP
jgi:AcrR family transcriptional regulator